MSISTNFLPPAPIDDLLSKLGPYDARSLESSPITGSALYFFPCQRLVYSVEANLGSPEGKQFAGEVSGVFYFYAGGSFDLFPKGKLINGYKVSEDKGAFFVEHLIETFCKKIDGIEVGDPRKFTEITSIYDTSPSFKKKDDRFFQTDNFIFEIAEELVSPAYQEKFPISARSSYGARRWLIRFNSQELSSDMCLVPLYLCERTGESPYPIWLTGWKSKYPRLEAAAIFERESALLKSFNGFLESDAGQELAKKAKDLTNDLSTSLNQGATKIGGLLKGFLKK